MNSIRKLIRGEEITAMKPFYGGYSGEIVEKPGTGSFSVQGRIERIDDTSIRITELPLKKWTHEYKVFLELMLTGDGKKKEPEIRDFKENHTDTTVDFTVIASKEQIDEFEKDKNGLYGKFKLTSTIATSNMNAFDTRGRIRKYRSPEDVLTEFYALRLDYYDRRKELLLHTMRREQRMLSNKARFVEEVCRDELIVSNRKRAEILAELLERGYELFDSKKPDNEEEEPEEEELSDAELVRGYEYLLGMKIWSLTFEKAEELRRQLAEKTKLVEDLEATSPSQLWLNDLDDIDEALDERDARMAKDAANELKAQTKGKRNLKKTIKKKTAAAKKKAKKTDDWDSDLENELSDDDDKVDFFSSEDESEVPKKAPSRKAPVKKTATKKNPAPTKIKSALIGTDVKPDKVKSEKAKVTPTPLETHSDSDDEFVSLSQRLKDQMSVGATKKKSITPVKREHGSTTDQEEDNTNSLEDFNVTDFKPASLTPSNGSKGTRKPPAKKARGKNSGAATKKAVKTTKKMVKKQVVESDSDDFFDEEESDLEEITAAPAPAPSRTGRSTRGAKKNYAIDLDSSDDDITSD
eukprot:CAMPEP_0202466646 /NCGR_PEP_ID=MMETSP1360-20130828/69376_1 /ASSEMBLY_ACC=CAM_ASM_000848 /TAXON_ID=515479 /ORGANISM="Licmophora paradoxa, Strain CCMP2313" /LENGTH=579 /DNA_ID=CAMNT_0049090859 /DNA_START=33 /DNA_END=1772 /DNA_ORIENTATION=-